MTTIGEKVWNRLRAEGGFVWTTSDGRKFVHFNKGCRCSPELRDILKRHSEDLKAFVDARHAAADRSWRVPALPPGCRFFPAPQAAVPIGRDSDARDCNAEMRSNISAKTCEIEGSAGPVAKIAAISAAAALLGCVFVPAGEIWTALAAIPGGSVGLGNALLTKSSSGGGVWVYLADSGVNTKTGR